MPLFDRQYCEIALQRPCSAKFFYLTVNKLHQRRAIIFSTSYQTDIRSFTIKFIHEVPRHHDRGLHRHLVCHLES